MRRYALRDDQWDRIKEILPGREGHVGDGGGQSAVRRSRSVQISRRRPLARSARALWRLEDRLSALEPVGQSGVFERVLRLLATITTTST